MKRVSVLVVMVACVVAAAPGTLSFRDEQMKFPRVLAAAKDKDEALKQLFVGKSLSYPPRAIFLRAFKKEAVLELRVENPSGSYTLAKNYPSVQLLAFWALSAALATNRFPKVSTSWTGSTHKVISF